MSGKPDLEEDKAEEKEGKGVQPPDYETDQDSHSLSSHSSIETVKEEKKDQTEEARISLNQIRSSLPLLNVGSLSGVIGNSIRSN